jgi:hypothetical protein
MEHLFCFVDKKDDMLKMCVDHYVLNKNKIKNNYPLLCIDDLLDWRTMGQNILANLISS